MNDYKILYDMIDFPSEAADITEKIHDRIIHESDFMQKYITIRNDFFAGKETLSAIEALAHEKGIESMSLALAFTVLYSSTMRSIYCERGISDDIYYDSLRDLTIWAKVAKRDFGIWGIHEYNWVSHQLRGEMFRLGRLQFHYSTFECDGFSRGGYKVKKGDVIINMHIPEGESLTHEKCVDSYRRAYKFFGCNIFVCHSWLLYPRHEEFLPKSSNILEFMHDFSIIKSSESDDTDNMWRIYGRRDKYIPSELPRDTGLRRAYAEWLETSGKTGEGYGVFFFDGENIIR